MPVVNIWLIINVIGLINVAFIVLIVLEEMPSTPQLVIGVSLSIIDRVISSFILKSENYYYQYQSDNSGMLYS